MEQTLIIRTETKDGMALILKDILELTGRHEGAVIDVFDTPLSAFADREGPFRVDQLVEDERLEGRLHDQRLMDAIGEAASEEIETNLVGSHSRFAHILDDETLEDIAITCAVEAFKEKIDGMDSHDRAIAETFIEDYDDRDSRDDEDEEYDEDDEY